MKGQNWHSWLECSLDVTATSYSLDILITTTPPHQEMAYQPTNPASHPPAPFLDAHQSLSTPLIMPVLVDFWSGSGSAGALLPYREWDAPMCLPNLTTVDTNFDLMLEYNTKLKFSWTDWEDRWKVTEQEQSYAMKAMHVMDIEDFKKKVSIFEHMFTL